MALKVFWLDGDSIVAHNVIEALETFARLYDGEYPTIIEEGR